MTASQIQNFQDPMQYLTAYSDIAIRNQELLQDILMPENPIKQKFFYVWNKNKNKILNDEKLCSLYGKHNIKKCFEEISSWTITKMKNYVGLYMWKYGKNISFYGFDFRIKDENAKVQHKIIFKICQEFLGKYCPDYDYYDLADWHITSEITHNYKKEDVVEIETYV